MDFFYGQAGCATFIAPSGYESLQKEQKESSYYYSWCMINFLIFGFQVTCNLLCN